MCVFSLKKLQNEFSADPVSEALPGTEGKTTLSKYDLKQTIYHYIRGIDRQTVRAHASEHICL